MATVFLKPNKDERVATGHLWVFAGEIARIEGQVEDGGVVDVRAYRGEWIGRGFINRKSALTVRLLTFGHEDLDDAFFRRRLEEALAYRHRLLGPRPACRLVYGEADGLPGLIVDRYAELVVVQTLALAMDLRKAKLADVLADLLHPTAIYERNDPPVRRLEGLPSVTGWLRGETNPVVEVPEERALFAVDVAHGQKTGFFLDQRENRVAASALYEGARVLDAFCYTGAFAVQAALAGAVQVTGIESSADAVVMAQRNASLNGVTDRCTFTVANAFDELRRLLSIHAQFDVVILDPPPFARGKESVDRALAGYKEINLRAMKLLRPGGFLITCSCSHHVGEALLLEVVASAALDAQRSVRLIESRGQSRDHPVHLAMPETRYLTCLILEVRRRST
jgi:23S rRNA (cytosine1962-C5)-methyltransferase